MRDYLEPEYRDRIGLVVDSLGDQRARIVDFNPATGKNDFMRMFPQPQEWVRWLSEPASRYDPRCNVQSPAD